MGERLVQYAAALLRQGHEPAVVTRELDHGRAELAGECHGTAVGELPLRRGPDGATMRVDAARSASRRIRWR